GNQYAMARRLGIMYIIWNHQFWALYNVRLGWQSYSGDNPHTDHVHFSFYWAGALQQTTYCHPEQSCTSAAKVTATSACGNESSGNLSPGKTSPGEGEASSPDAPL